MFVVKECKLSMILSTINECENIIRNIHKTKDLFKNQTDKTILMMIKKEFINKQKRMKLKKNKN